MLKGLTFAGMLALGVAGCDGRDKNNSESPTGPDAVALTQPENIESGDGAISGIQTEIAGLAQPTYLPADKPSPTGNEKTIVALKDGTEERLGTNEGTMHKYTHGDSFDPNKNTVMYAEVSRSKKNERPGKAQLPVGIKELQIKSTIAAKLKYNGKEYTLPARITDISQGTKSLVFKIIFPGKNRGEKEVGITFNGVFNPEIKGIKTFQFRKQVTVGTNEPPTPQPTEIPAPACVPAGTCDRAGDVEADMDGDGKTECYRGTTVYEFCP